MYSIISVTEKGFSWAASPSLRKWFFGHALVHRFVNNCIIHAGYGFECAVKKRRRSGLRWGFLNCAIGFVDKWMIQLFRKRCTSIPHSRHNAQRSKSVSKTPSGVFIVRIPRLKLSSETDMPERFSFFAYIFASFPLHMKKSPESHLGIQGIFIRICN